MREELLKTGQFVRHGDAFAVDDTAGGTTKTCAVPGTRFYRVQNLGTDNVYMEVGDAKVDPQVASGGSTCIFAGTAEYFQATDSDLPKLNFICATGESTSVSIIWIK
jgi:hypothetical protein